jgi:hypothetical protein
MKQKVITTMRPKINVSVQPDMQTTLREELQTTMYQGTVKNTKVLDMMNNIITEKISLNNYKFLKTKRENSSIYFYFLYKIENTIIKINMFDI